MVCVSVSVSVSVCVVACYMLATFTSCPSIVSTSSGKFSLIKMRPEDLEISGGGRKGERGERGEERGGGKDGKMEVVIVVEVESGTGSSGGVRRGGGSGR